MQNFGYPASDHFNFLSANRMFHGVAVPRYGVAVVQQLLMTCISQPQGNDRVIHAVRHKNGSLPVRRMSFLL